CLNGPVQGCCSADLDCDDGDACNGLETCDFATRICQAGTPVVCDDGNVCTTDTCDHATGTCSFPPIAGCCNADPDCNDNDACTTDTCDTVQNVCNHTPAVTCDDGLFCNGLETCNPQDGTCVLGSAPTCDDGMVCTADSCDPAANNNAGGCVNAPIAGCCTTDADCDDGDVCTGTETCDTNTGACQNGTPLVCDNGNPCDGLETCDPVAGCQPGTLLDCNDNQGGPAGNAGTECRPAAGDCDVAEVCDGTNAACPADATQPSGTACTDDGNPCTTDTCDGTSTTCQHAAGNAGTECRAAASDCDVAEACDGTNTACPADASEARRAGCARDCSPSTTDA